MRVLSVSDEVVAYLQSEGIHQKLGALDAIVGCGDLPPSYLEYLVSVLNVPCLYVNGNHNEPEVRASGKTTAQPDGCEHLDLRTCFVGGLLFAGASGVLKYRPGLYQYSEQAWQYRMITLTARVLIAQQRYRRKLDVLITHTPPAGLHDATGAHRGPAALRQFVERMQPRYVIHGHIHLNYGYGDQSPLTHGNSLIINTHGYRLLEIEVEAKKGIVQRT